MGSAVVSSPAVSPAPSAASDVAGNVLFSLEGVGKAYRLYRQPQDRLKEQLFWRFGRTYGHDFWAVRGVSLQVRRGERVGIIGRNGSGKSTLLQMIAGTLAPTEGRVVVRGRLAALLELGSGFNPNFTGRENVLLNATLLGLSRDEIESRLDQIVAFADIGEFLDQPAKMYSSGMLIRLAFSVCTAVEADVLLVDEALAVGDVFFRQKCYERLNDLQARGTAVVLVTHSMSEVLQFCERALLLVQGHPAFLGPAAEAVERYYLAQQEKEPARAKLPVTGAVAAPSATDLGWPSPSAFIDLTGVPQVSVGDSRCTSLAVCDESGRPCRAFRQGERAVFFYEFETGEDIEVPVGGLLFQSDNGAAVHGKSTLEHGTDVPRPIPAGSRLRFRQVVTLALGVGEYTVTPGLACVDAHAYDQRALLTHIQLSSSIRRMCNVPQAASFTVMVRQPCSPVQLLHHGLADLPGDCTVGLRPAEKGRR
jgi:lipopolysaccharide transport system ATP-binding protein